MTSRSPTALSRPLRGLTTTVGALRTGTAAALLPALLTFSLAALLLATAPALTAASTGDGTEAEPAFVAGPLLSLLALAPAAAAWLLAVFDRPAAAAGLIGSLGLIAVGRAVYDLQLLADPWSAARPELLVPNSLAELTAGPAVPLLLAGHALTVVAGVLALVALLRSRGSAEWDGPGWTADERVDGGVDGPVGGGGSGALVAALCAGTIAAAGLVSSPFRSTDPHLIPVGAVDAALPTLLGLLLVAGAVVLAGCLAASAADVSVARGGLAGAATGAAIVALPPLAAAAASDSIKVSAGPLVALGGAALLAGTAWRIGRRPAPDAGERLPAAWLLYRVAGVLAISAGVAGLLAALTRQLTVAEFVELPVVYPARLLVPAGALLVVVGVLVLVPRLAGYARPALAVSWAALALAATATLDLTLTATQVDGVHIGFGVWPAALALLLAPAAGAAAAVAGSVEREEDDLTDLAERPQDRALQVAGWLAAALAVPAFGLPLVSSAVYQPAGLWSRFAVASWGLLAAAAVVAGAGLLAPRSRPSRALGLLLGAAAVVAVHVSAVPLVGGRGETPVTVAAGTWFALACGLALLAGAAVAAGHDRRDHRNQRDRNRRKGTKYAPGRSKTGGRSSRSEASRASRSDARRSRERSHPRGRRQARA